MERPGCWQRFGSLDLLTLKLLPQQLLKSADSVAGQPFRAWIILRHVALWVCP